MSDDAASAAVQPSGEAEHIGAMLHISEQWITDTTLDLSAAFLRHFEESFNQRIETAAFSGDGTADENYGGFTGIFAHSDVTVVVAAAGNTTVQTLDRDDLVNTVAAVDAPVLQRRPRWWMHPALLAPLMKVQDASGQPVLGVTQEPGDTPFSLLGFPVTLSAGAPSTNAANSKVLAFGDGRAMGLGIRREFQLQASAHHRWNTLQRSYRGIGRACIKMRKGSMFAVLKTAAA
jgi:HK97 family phage major capsid protein